MINFRKARIDDESEIWDILQKGIIRRKNDGSNQWQDGYPNPQIIRNDIEKEAGYVLTEGENIIGYFTMLINDEPAYAEIKGKWLSNDDYVVIHRVAISEKYLRKGLAKEIFNFAESFAVDNNIFSIKVDTNFDNIAMLKLLENMGYIYCGEVLYRGSPRKAFEKAIVGNAN